MEDLSYANFYQKIEKELASQNEFDELREREKKCNKDTKRVIDEHRKAQEEAIRDECEMNIEIQEAKKKLNETKTEAELHTQYLER